MTKFRFKFLVGVTLNISLYYLLWNVTILTKFMFRILVVSLNIFTVLVTSEYNKCDKI